MLLARLLLSIVRCSLEDVELLRGGTEVRDSLDRRRPGPDDRDALVRELVQVARAVTPAQHTARLGLVASAFSNPRDICS